MRIALLVTGLVVVVLAAALGGFLAGDVLAEDDTKRQVEEAEQRGYSEGFGAGLATGEAQACLNHLRGRGEAVISSQSSDQVEG